MPKKREEHTHKYMRIILGRKSRNYRIYRCVLPGCAHYVNAELIGGMDCICWRCDKEFTIPRRKPLKKPHCMQCTERKKPLSLNLAEKMLEGRLTQ